MLMQNHIISNLDLFKTYFVIGYIKLEQYLNKPFT